jgi:hypothetical protein
MELNLQFYQIYSSSYEFQKFKLNLEIELNNSNRKCESALLHWVARPIRPFVPWQPKLGKIPILTGAQLADQFWLAGSEWSSKVVPGSTPVH